MTARGFGKRNGEYENSEENYNESELIELCCWGKNFQVSIFLERKFDSTDEYREDGYNRYREKPILFPFMNQYIKNPEDYVDRDNGTPMPGKNHRLQIRDGTLKFRLNDGNLRIGRGFGKRSEPTIDQ